MDRIVYWRRLLFEYWAHAACLVPAAYYPAWCRAMLDYSLRRRAWGAWLQRSLGDDARPSIVVSIATAGDLVRWHPHLHLLTTDGGKTADGSWKPLPEWDALLLMGLFRERLLARLVDSHAISPEHVSRLLCWKHPGFSAHVGKPIEPGHKQHLEGTAAYLVRNPLSLRKLVYLDGERAVIYYRSRMNPSLGRNFEAMDPLEWLARLSDHIPDPGQHRTLFYGEYSNRVRGCVSPPSPPRRRARSTNRAGAPRRAGEG